MDAAQASFSYRLDEHPKPFLYRISLIKMLNVSGQDFYFSAKCLSVYANKTSQICSKLSKCADIVERLLGAIVSF